MVEMRGVEPLSKSSPTFRHLQFSSPLDKTAELTVNRPSAESACEFFRNHPTGVGIILSVLVTQPAEKRLIRQTGSLQDFYPLGSECEACASVIVCSV